MKNVVIFKTALFFGLVFLLILSYIGPCENRVMKCLGGNSILLVRTFVHLVIPIIFSLFILFFLSDNIFMKWFKFSLGWVFLSLFFIFITPEYSGGWVSFTPDREQVSIWMSSLFFIISLVLITFWSLRERKDQEK